MMKEKGQRQNDEMAKGVSVLGLSLRRMAAPRKWVR